MLRKLTYLAATIYPIVHFGQELMLKGSFGRMYFYFIGMSIFSSLVTFIVMKSIKNKATIFLFSITLGVTFNNILSCGEYHEIEVFFAIVGLFYILAETRIKKCVKLVTNLKITRTKIKALFFLALALAGLCLFCLKYGSQLNTLFQL